jgi:hypothetical protein
MAALCAVPNMLRDTLIRMAKLSIRIFLGLGFLCLAQMLEPQWVPTRKGHPQPISPNDIALMAWGPSSSDPDALREMREAGLNISGFCHVGDLAAVEAAGLKCFVDDPRVNGYDWTNPAPDIVLKQRIAELQRQLSGHPGAIGFFLTDEPSMAAMPALGKVSRLLRDAMPDRLSYVNLFPYQVSKERLGTDYDSYVRALVKTVGQSFLSYDNYALVNGELNDQFYTNLEIVRRLGIELKTPFWNCIQSNAHYSYAEPTDANLHLQAYASLAYGSRGIQYFTYFTPGHGNFRLAPIDVMGYRTATWDMLRRVNGEIAMLAPTLGKLHSTGVYHYPRAPPEGRALSESPLVERIEMTEHRLVAAPTVGRVLVGEFMDAANKPYLMIVNKDLQRSFVLQVYLRDKRKKLVLISQYTGNKEEFSGERQWIQPGGGFLFRVE